MNSCAREFTQQLHNNKVGLMSTNYNIYRKYKKQMADPLYGCICYVMCFCVCIDMLSVSRLMMFVLTNDELLVTKSNANKKFTFGLRALHCSPNVHVNILNIFKSCMFYWFRCFAMCLFHQFQAAVVFLSEHQLCIKFCQSYIVVVQ